MKSLKTVNFILPLLLIAAPVAAVYAQPSPKIYFNHFYHVFDRETFAAILESEFIKNEFANVDTGLPNFAAPQETAGNLYVRGKNTYLEILGVSNSFKEPIGKGGIALAVDNRDDLSKVFQLLAKNTPAAFGRELATRDFPDAPKTPWYELIYRKFDQPNAVDYWITEYKSEFFKKLKPVETFDAADVSRARYLAQQFNVEKLLLDVDKLSVALPTAQKSLLIEDLTSIGFTKIREKSGETVLRGTNFEISVMDENSARRGILSVGMKLNRRMKKKEIHSFGTKSKLTLDKDSATWIF